MLGAAESVEVGEHCVAFDLARVLHAQVVGIGVHAHHLLLDLLGRVRQIDAVAEALAHLGLAVGSRQAHAGRVLGQQDFRLDERFAVHRVEFVDDFARLLDHRLLVLAHGHGRGPEGRDVRRLADGVGEESDGNALTLGRVAFGGALGESAQGDLGLHGRVALQTLHGDQVHVVERQFAQFRHLRLDEERRFRGVETHREVVQRHFDDILTHLFRVVGIVGERLRIGDHNEYFVELARVLQLDAAAERTHEVAQVEPARGTVAGKDDFCHIFRESTFCRRRYEKLCGNAKKLSDIDFFYIFAFSNRRLL